MIKLYAWTTPNGYKVPIMLEELGLPYEIIPVDIHKGEQLKPAFLAMNPNNKIPVLVDGKTTVFESGAILIYLGEKYAKKISSLLPAKGPRRYEVLEWLMFQMAGIGPMLGQANHFHKYAPKKVPYALDRYDKEAARLFGVMETKLKHHDFLVGSYSVADIAAWPWVRIYENLEIDIQKYPGVKRWLSRMQKRPAVQRALKKTDEACGE